MSHLVDVLYLMAISEEEGVGEKRGDRRVRRRGREEGREELGG